MNIETLFSLKGKTAVITGASSGIGAEFARALAAAGANIVVAARRLDRLEALCEELSRQSTKCFAVRCDVSLSSDVDQLVEQACRTFGRVDIMINNAAILAGSGMMPEKLTVDAAKTGIDVNLLGVWYGCQAAGRKMLSDGKGGSIINVGSIGGQGGFPEQDPLYGAAKAGVANLTRNLASSWGDRGVRVNNFIPGWFPTEMAEYFLASKEGRDYANAHIPLGRVGKMSELWGPVIYLASEASSYMNGCDIVMDGGACTTIGHKLTPEMYKAMEQMPEGLGKRIQANIQD